MFSLVRCLVRLTWETASSKSQTARSFSAWQLKYAPVVSAGSPRNFCSEIRVVSQKLKALVAGSRLQLNMETHIVKHKARKLEVVVSAESANQARVSRAAENSVTLISPAGDGDHAVVKICLATNDCTALALRRQKRQATTGIVGSNVINSLFVQYRPRM